MSSDIHIWKTLPFKKLREKTPQTIIKKSSVFTDREQKQIVNCFDSESYELVSYYVLNRTKQELREQISLLGMGFIAKLLNRLDLNEDSSPDELSMIELLKVAKSLGMLDDTQKEKICNSHRYVICFSNGCSSTKCEAAKYSMSKKDAVDCLKVAVEITRAQESEDVHSRLQRFSEQLFLDKFKLQDKDVKDLSRRTYRDKKVILSLLLSKLSSLSEINTEVFLHNFSIIIPTLWGGLRQADKWQLGELYKALYSAGNSYACSVLQEVLLEVHGLEYVPKSLGVKTYSQYASKLLASNEESCQTSRPLKLIQELKKIRGPIPNSISSSLIPSILMIVINRPSEQNGSFLKATREILDRLSEYQWTLFFDESVSVEASVLKRLREDDFTRKNWLQLASIYRWDRLPVENQNVKMLLKASVDDAKLDSYLNRWYQRPMK